MPPPSVAGRHSAVCKAARLALAQQRAWATHVLDASGIAGVGLRLPSTHPPTHLTYSVTHHPPILHPYTAACPDGTPKYIMHYPTPFAYFANGTREGCGRGTEGIAA